MLKKEVVALWNILRQIENKQFESFKFTYALAKNKRIITPEVKAFQEMAKPSPKFQKYINKKKELLSKLSKKDEKGNPVIENNLYVMENLKEADVEMEKLIEENKEVIEEGEIAKEKFDEFMNKEIDLKLHKVKLKNVPKKGLSPIQMEILILMIDEE